MSNAGNGQVSYLEIPATDIEATKKFYAGLFGWTFRDWGTDYTSFQDGRTAGGFAKVDGPPAKGVLIVLYASDLEATEAAVKAAGGKVVKPVFSFPGGRRFHFEDPNGNELAIWSEDPDAEQAG
jgi:uncharacterized protein